MRLLNSGLVRFFALGFVLGAVGLFATIGIGPDRVTPQDVVPTAVAAPAK